MIEVLGVLVFGMFFFLGYAVGACSTLLQDRHLDEEFAWTINYVYNKTSRNSKKDELFSTPDWKKDELKARFPPTAQITTNLWFMLVDWDTIRKANGELKDKLAEMEEWEEL